MPKSTPKTHVFTLYRIYTDAQGKTGFLFLDAMTAMNAHSAARRLAEIEHMDYVVHDVDKCMATEYVCRTNSGGVERVYATEYLWRGPQ